MVEFNINPLHSLFFNHAASLERKKFLFGKFNFQHKGRKKPGRKNYPPLPRVVKTGRQQRPSLRGFRKLQRAEDRAGFFSARLVAHEAVNNHLANLPSLKRLEAIRTRHASSFYIHGE
jgi:hypothetical protein